MADEIFNQADLNKDQVLDMHEFRSLLLQNLGLSGAALAGNVVNANQFTASSYGTAGDDMTAYTGITGLAGNIVGGAGNVAAAGSYGAYEQASSSAVVDGLTTGFNVNAIANGDATVTGVVAAESSSSSTFEASNVRQETQQYATNAQGLYQDPNPQIIRRPAQGGQITYTQNVKIRFLQPPPIPPPGPLIIKEVRPPQPPPPPPLVVRQRAPPLPNPPPLILRERPPPIPPSVAAQTVVRNLPPLPVPPRSVIIERMPALPPKPRDIIIERWIPYGAMAKRKTIVQRAEPPKGYSKPRNIIIQYDSPQVRVVRQFQRLGVTPENPEEYVKRYGSSLFDMQTLLERARAAGVVEDISPPTNINLLAGGTSSFGVDVTSSGVVTGTAASGVNGLGGGGGGGGAGAGITGVSSSSSFESSNFAVQQGTSGFSGFESAQSVSGVDMGTSFESSGFASTGGAAGFGGITTTGYQTYNTPGNVMNLANAAFDAADLNKDGTIDPREFRQFLSARIQ